MGAPLLNSIKTRANLHWYTHTLKKVDQAKKESTSTRVREKESHPTALPTTRQLLKFEMCDLFLQSAATIFVDLIFAMHPLLT